MSAFDDGERIILDAHGAESGLIIGKKGATLDALQYVINRIISKKPSEGPGVIVDAEGYRGRREDSLRICAAAGGEGDQERPAGSRRADEPARSAHRPRHARRSPGGHHRVRGRGPLPARGDLPEEGRAAAQADSPSLASRGGRSRTGAPSPASSKSARMVGVGPGARRAREPAEPTTRRPVTALDGRGVSGRVRSLPRGLSG